MTGAEAAASAPAGAPRWWRIALGGGGGMFAAMGLGRFSLTAMVPALISAGELTAIEAGRVGMVNLWGFVLGALASEWARRRVPVHRLLEACVAATVFLLALSAVPWGAIWLGACRAVIGVATGILMVQSLALITATAPAGRRPVAASFMFAGVGLGILASGQLVPVLAAWSLTAAWLGLAAAGLAAACLASWGWREAAPTGGQKLTPAVAPAGSGAGGSIAAKADAGTIWTLPLATLAVAHTAFAFGIVPHTLYWVDTVARGLGHGLDAGGLHWSIVGIFSVLGPWLTTALAMLVGTAWALVLAFLALAIGIAWPAAWPALPVLFASSVAFGMQPGLSSLMAARTRDLGTADAMPRVMRAMILGNSAGSAFGGILVPSVYAAGGYPAALMLGGAAMLAGALLSLPGWERLARRA